MNHERFSVILALAAVLVLGAGLAMGTTFIGIGTGGTGGIYYPYGGGVAEIWSKYVKGSRRWPRSPEPAWRTSSWPTRARRWWAWSWATWAKAGYNGTGKFKGKKHKILGMAIMYPNLLQVVVLKNSPITSIEQVKGKSVSTGSPGSGTNFMSEAVLKALGVPRDSYKDKRLSFTETANALRDGTIEVGFWSVGPGTSSIMDLATTHDIRILAFTPEQQKKVIASNPTYAAVDLGGGVYRGVDKPVPTIGVWNVMIVQKSRTPTWSTTWSAPCGSTTTTW